MIQELFISSQEICHSRFNFYWLSGKKKKIQVMIVVEKDLGDKIIADHRTDLIYHLYFLLYKIRKVD